MRFISIIWIFFSINSFSQDISTLFENLQAADAGYAYLTIKSLQIQSKNYFNKDDKALLINHIKNTTLHLDELIKLTGYLELREAIPQLKNIADSSVYSPRDRWAAYLALSRMDDQQAISFINNKIRSAKVDDDFIYDIVPDLIYTRNRSIYNYLITLLMDDTPHCTSANPDNEAAITCGYRLMEYFAPVIKNYPLKITPSGDVDTNNYPKALKNTRDWFSKNQENYIISRESF